VTAQAKGRRLTQRATCLGVKIQLHFRPNPAANRSQAPAHHEDLSALDKLLILNLDYYDFVRWEYPQNGSL
jgi:hypothetical protein